MPTAMYRGVVPSPPAGFLYHGVFVSGPTGDESSMTLSDLRSYESTAGKRAAWAYFSHNWFEGRAFPVAKATWVREAGSIPFIRLMLRSSSRQGVAEPLFTLQNIIDGRFDVDLHKWGAAAREFGSPLIVEYGTEVNGEWFAWNGVWNGAGTTNGYGDPTQADGPERFRDAYRHIIRICREEDAANITWVYHINATEFPADNWNKFENYYPGATWIDWIGISNYGALTPFSDRWVEFRADMDVIYPRVEALAAGKSIIVAEFGVDKNNPNVNQANWTRNALTDITSLRWPKVIGFSWWNEKWQNDENPAHDTTMRLEDNPALQTVFRSLVGSNGKVLGSAAP